MPTRQYNDPSGVEWEVFEVRRLNDRPNSVRPALSSGWLAFVSEREKRRLPQYPPDWMDLADDELQELLLTAFVARDPAPLITPPRQPGSFPAVSRGLPVPPPATVSGTLGSVGVEQLVRAHARQARQNGVPVIEGMIGVKRALSEAGEDASPATIKLLRKAFVEEFYFPA